MDNISIHKKHSLHQEAYQILDHLKELSLSGDMSAAKLFCELVFRGVDSAEDINASSGLTDEQALQITTIADDQIAKGTG